MAITRPRVNSATGTVSGAPTPAGALIQATAMATRARATVPAPTRGWGRRRRRGVHPLVLMRRAIVRPTCRNAYYPETVIQSICGLWLEAQAVDTTVPITLTRSVAVTAGICGVSVSNVVSAPQVLGGSAA